MSLCCSSIYVCQQDLTRFLYFDTETLISFLFYKWYQTKILCQRWMNICRLRYELLVSPQLNSLPILISYTQGTVLHWNRRDLLTLSILFMGFFSSRSQLLHSKKKIKLGACCSHWNSSCPSPSFWNRGSNYPVNGFEGTCDAFARVSKTKYNNRINIL